MLALPGRLGQRVDGEPPGRERPRCPCRRVVGQQQGHIALQLVEIFLPVVLLYEGAQAR